MACAAGPEYDERHAKLAAQQIDAVLPMRVLKTLLRHARVQLSDPVCGFHVELPDDDAPLTERIDALASWTQAFLEGFSLALEAERRLGLDPESAELVADLTRIGSELSFRNVAQTETNERDLIEVASYVELAAMNLYLSANPPLASSADDAMDIAGRVD